MHVHQGLSTVGDLPTPSTELPAHIKNNPGLNPFHCYKVEKTTEAETEMSELG